MKKQVNTTLRDGLRILDFLAYADGPKTLTEIANGIFIGKSKAHRLLQTLVESRYVFRPDGSTRYRASIRLWTLGSAILRHDRLRAVAQEPMEALMRTTGESIHLSLLEGLEVVYLHKVESNNPVRSYSQIGGRAPAHKVATGKAILAFNSEHTLRKLHANIVSTGQSDDLEAFLEEMKQIKKDRVALNRGGWNQEVFGISSPIQYRQGSVIAAVGVSGPAVHFDNDTIERYSALVLQTANKISHALTAPDPELWADRPI